MDFLHIFALANQLHGVSLSRLQERRRTFEM